MPENSLSATKFTGLSSAVRALVPTADLVRVFAVLRAVAHVYGDGFERLLVDRDVEREATRLIRWHFAAVADWRYAHDFHVPTGCLYLSPAPVQRGYVPEDDRTFGLSPLRYIATADGGAR